MAHPGDAVFHLMRRVLQDHGAVWQSKLPELTKPQFAVLSTVAATPDIDQVTVGARAAVDKATLAGMLRRLEERGLITKTADSVDRRRFLLRLTAKGKAVVRATTPLADDADAQLLTRLTATEQRQLRKLLLKLAAPDGADTQ
ncbi:MarR family winged helix-turn-helix transcriptional regulator [Nocardia pseudobrasiliensis]|uniref:MarR family transcriptional regulator n=1 Tax=Nocardia pseudobrasiliensis TaxID=45979 RepID=A0A370I9Y2_9NOCA|nr:MarR family winged helix-turn-helix transcriptional regulator [Nocardia pseudobrasiliensis]RDI66931.1 MarR family transcriptional regulator [Nocardia pseudobrasiliensis]